jgi:hypothetical protein
MGKLDAGGEETILWKLPVRTAGSDACGGRPC